MGVFQPAPQRRGCSRRPTPERGPKGTLWGNGTPGGLGDPANPTMATNPALAFEEDCANGVLPDVSSIGTNAAVWEHPSNIPAAGAQFLASKLDALAANDDLWNTTAFVINYDENDGFFDHVVPPTPDPAQFPGVRPRSQQGG